jgi:hypothetical protein
MKAAIEQGHSLGGEAGMCLLPFPALMRNLGQNDSKRGARLLDLLHGLQNRMNVKPAWCDGDDDKIRLLGCNMAMSFEFAGVSMMMRSILPLPRPRETWSGRPATLLSLTVTSSSSRRSDQ